MLTIQVMGTELTPEQRKTLMREATEENKWTQAGIARAIGTSPQNVYNMMKREGTDSPYLPLLDQWLIDDLGHPDTRLLLTVYRGLATVEQGAAYFDIVPPNH